MHSMTPGRDSRMPRSIAPLLPVMPMAVRRDPGMGWAFRPRLSMRLQTSRTCSSVACDCITTSMDNSPGAVSEIRVYGMAAEGRKCGGWACRLVPITRLHSECQAVGPCYTAALVAGGFHAAHDFMFRFPLRYFDSYVLMCQSEWANPAPGRDATEDR